MALKLVTAPPGTGKTLLLIRMIFEYLAEGRRVYSNISGLKIAEVLPIPSNADWRDLYADRTNFKKPRPTQYNRQTNDFELENDLNQQAALEQRILANDKL